MRWDKQRADGNGEQALLGLGGLVRSVSSPEFSGVTFHEVRARSVLNKVPGASRVPFGWTVNPYRGCSHACTYCLAGETEILMANGRRKALSDVLVGDEIYGTRREGRHRRYVRTKVLAHWSTVKHAYRVTLEDGTELVAGGDHRFLTDRGWKHVTGTTRPSLRPGSRIVGTGRFAPGPEHARAYRAGYLCGMVKGDGSPAPEASARSNEFLAGFASLSEVSELPAEPEALWQKGFLGGLFDARGSSSRDVLRIASSDRGVVAALSAALDEFGFRHTVEERDRPTGPRGVRLIGGLAERIRFLHTVDPAISAKRSLEGTMIRAASRIGVVSVRPLGIRLPLFDITTGTGDFIADGMVSHNCFARNTHTYLDFDAGRDFDTQVVVKVNAPEVLRSQLARPSWRHEHVAMGTNTDPYQRAEGRYRLMPRIITALADSGTPLSILTKGTVLARDLPLLERVSADVPVGLAVSIALLDPELQRRLEPGTPSPRARLDLVRKARAAGLPCSVLVAPVLPGLTDSVEALDALFAELSEAGATSVSVIPLHLRPGAREWFAQWLAREHPGLVPTYRRIYGKGSYASAGYRARLAERVGVLLRRNGLASRADYEPREEGAVPEQRQREPAEGAEQLRLL